MNLTAYLFFSSLLLLGCSGKKDPRYCDVCRALISIINWKMSQVDPKKTIQVGSFRVDTHGEQTKVENKQYAKSEAFLEETFENICQDMKDFGELTYENGTKTIVRVRGFDGVYKFVKDPKLSLNSNIGKTLQFKCDSLLEDHEEDIILLIQKHDSEESERKICGEQTEACTEEQLSRPMDSIPPEEEQDIPDMEEDNEEDAEETSEEPSEEEENVEPMDKTEL